MSAVLGVSPGHVALGADVAVERLDELLTDAFDQLLAG